MGIITDTIKSIFQTLNKLSRPYFSLEDNQLKFKIDSDKFFYYSIDNLEIKTRHDSYVLEAYTINSDDIYLEYIHTDVDANWNGLPLPHFIELLKTNLKLNSMDLLEKKEFKHYDFLTYKINNEYILNIIYIYELNKDIFIIDTKSNLYEKLLKNFDKSYVYNFEKNKNIALSFNLSLVRNNAINNYFGLNSSED
jgi:hypothetical protein